MKTVILSLCALVCFASQSKARIGETLEQCIQRYGAVVKQESGIIVFKKSGFFVMVKLYNEKVEQIAFCKAQADELGQAGAISDNEIELLLKTNGGASNWKVQPVISTDRHWQTEDESLFAHYTTIDHMLVIQTKDCVVRDIESEKAKEKQNLNSF
ncbi:MAG: hypothetical protein QM796_18680 [Chthoniobacteraceae bacterium]